MKLRCLLIDDEPPALKILARYIESINGLEIVGQCKNAIEALDVLQQKTVDVIFLDIKMPHIIGTDFLKNLLHPPKVIFCYCIPRICNGWIRIRRSRLPGKTRFV
jgi:YesN/AraC family two-component response regulator